MTRQRDEPRDDDPRYTYYASEPASPPWFSSAAVALQASEAQSKPPPNWSGSWSPDYSQTIRSRESILFAAIACEGFIEDIAFTLPREKKAGSLCDELRDLAVLGSWLEDLEDLKASPKLKYQRAFHQLGSSAFDKGGDLHENYALLCDVRNAIVHPKASQTKMRNRGDVVSRGKELDKLISRIGHRAHPITRDYTPGFRTIMEDRSVARWACQTAHSLCSALRDSLFAKTGWDVRDCHPIDWWLEPLERIFAKNSRRIGTGSTNVASPGRDRLKGEQKT